MAQNFFIMDGKNYDLFVTEVKREGVIMDRDEAGRTLSGNMDRDILGTYYNYDIAIDTSQINPKDYDDFYERITAPVDSHTVTFPYGQSTLTYDAYVANVSDKLSRIDEDSNKWEGLTVRFTAMKPKRRA